MPLHGDDGDTGIESAWVAAIVSEASVALKPPRLLIEFRALCCRCPHPCLVLSDIGTGVASIQNVRCFFNDV